MSHDNIFKTSNLIGCLENKTADSAQTRKRAITRPFPSLGGRGLDTRLGQARNDRTFEVEVQRWTLVRL